MCASCFILYCPSLCLSVLCLVRIGSHFKAQKKQKLVFLVLQGSKLCANFFSLKAQIIIIIIIK